MELDQPGQAGEVLVAEEEERPVHLGREHRGPAEGLGHQVVLPFLEAAVEADAVVLELPEGRPVELRGELAADRAVAVVEAGRLVADVDVDIGLLAAPKEAVRDGQHVGRVVDAVVDGDEARVDAARFG
jgi:hypothetical protein